MDSREIGRLRQKCFSFGKTLLACKREFRFSLKVGDFKMSLGAGGTGDRKARPRCNRKRNPAYFRRQRRRREAFLEKKGLAGDSLVGRALGIGAETVVENIQDGEGGGEVGGQEQEQEEEVTLKDLYNLAIELSEINNQGRCEISELLNDTKNLLSSRTANLPNTSDVDEGDDEEQGSDENDLLVLFGSLGKQLKTFQRDLTRTDKKVESAKKVSSPLRKKRRKRR